MASIGELTAQVFALTDEVQTLMTRVAFAEQNATMSAQAPRVGMPSDSGIFDKQVIPQGAEGELIVQEVI